jgi:hypothetical protein
MEKGCIKNKNVTSNNVFMRTNSLQSKMHHTFLVYLTITICLFCLGAPYLRAQSQAPTFTGEPSDWHGFPRYDFIMDDATFAITPIKAPEGEKYSVGTPVKGQRRCIVVVPAKAAAGNPWSWQACYWDHEPQTEVELLKRGFHIAFITPDPGKQWDAWYTFLTEKYEFSKKPAFVGMSKGGVNEYDWTTGNPDKVSCIYADNPAIRPDAFIKLSELAKNDVPLLNVCGTSDFLLERTTFPIEKRYQELGGRITVMIKEGTAHHPHSIKNPKLIADWIEKNMKLTDDSNPDFVDTTFKKSYYYGHESSYIYLKEEDTYATSRGPGFTQCYVRYDVKTKSEWGITGMAVIVPNTIASGKPWIFRYGTIDENAAVDRALLAKGFHIVIAPLTGGNGAVKEEWDATYKFFTGHGFSKKPIMEGSGAGAAEACAWAILNPDKVASIYVENPAFRSLMLKTLLLDSLAPLAKAGVPLILVSGSLDPWLNSNTRVAAKRYKELHGKVNVIIREGEGHFLESKDPKPVVDLITKSIL